MKLRTSFSKLATFKKDLTRFAPVWALYLIGMMLIITEIGGYSTYDRFARNVMGSDWVAAFGIVNLCYAGICALVLFGDLYNTRMCYSLHTQPARRESLFLSHLAAALCFSLVPNAVAALYLMAELEAYWFLALYWLLASTLQFVFYFGLAAVSAMCAGNRVGMIAVYAVLNFFSMIAYWVVDTIYLPQMPGVMLNFEDFSLVCPTVELFNKDFFQFNTLDVWNEEYREWGYFYEYAGLGDGWGYLAVLGGIGIAMTVLAVVLYRARHLESAGDFVAFRRLSPVVCVVLTVCVAVAFAFLGDAMGSGYMVWLIVGLIVGFFGSRMLIERRVKVFRPKAFLGFGVLAAVLTVSFLAISFDVFNIVGYLPEADKVESVTISNYKKTNYYYDDYYYGNRITVKLEVPEEIEDIITAHEDILNRLDDDNYNHRVTISYKLKSGRTVIRSYAAPADGTNYEIFTKYFYTPQQILGFTDWDEYVKNMEYIALDSFEIPKDCYEEFLLALYADCEKGTVGTANNLKSPEYWVYLHSNNQDGGYTYRELAIQGDAVNTIALIKMPKISLGFENPSEVGYIDFVYVNGNEVKASQRAELMEALLKDFQNGQVTLEYSGGYYTVEYAFEMDNMTCYRHLSVQKGAENTIQWIEENAE